MRKNLYPMIAGTLVSLFVLTIIFEDKIDNASPIIQITIILLVGLVCIGAVLLALWDNKKNK